MNLLNLHILCIFTEHNTRHHVATALSSPSLHLYYNSVDLFPIYRLRTVSQVSLCPLSRVNSTGRHCRHTLPQVLLKVSHTPVSGSHRYAEQTILTTATLQCLKTKLLTLFLKTAKD